MKSAGKLFIKCYIVCIVDICGIKKIKGKAIYFPKELEEFFNRSDPSSYKNTRLNFNYNCLNRYANLLFRHLNTLWMENSQFV